MSTTSDFGCTPEGTPVSLFTIGHAGAVQAHITNYGGIITSLLVPDQSGTPTDVVLGFPTLDGYLAGHPYFGALVGRYANRIAGGCFTLDGVTCHLPINNGPNSLHGGLKGFDKVVWNAALSGETLQLQYLSRDGEEGYPGNLSVTVVYRIEGEGLSISYRATCDAPTILNLTNHSYFNLDPRGTDVLNHLVAINADHYTPVDQNLIPTGDLAPVEGSPLDFRTPRRIGDRIDSDYEQLYIAGGYDHNWVINGAPGALRFAGSALCETSGISLEVYTTEPGMQFYTGNFLDGTLQGKNGKMYGRRSGFCFETQHYPDSPNHAHFPSVILRPGATFESLTEFRFSRG